MYYMEVDYKEVREKNCIPNKLKRVTAALLLLFSTAYFLPQEITKSNTSNNAKSEKFESNNDFLKNAILTEIPPYTETIYDPKVNYNDLKVFPNKINILNGITVTKSTVPEIGHVNGCSTWMAGKHHWLVEYHCSADVGSVVWSDILPAGFGSYVTNVYTYRYDSGLGFKILEVEVELSDSKPILINSSTSNIHIGDKARICGYGLNNPGGTFPSPLSCATMSLFRISEFDGVLGADNIGQGYPYFGDSGAAFSIFDEDLKRWVSVGTQHSISPDLDKAAFTLNSAPQVIEFLKAHIPDAKFFSRTFLPKVSK